MERMVVAGGDRMSYDSTGDTEAHINQVRDDMRAVIKLLEQRAIDHDASKLESPEKEAFDLATPKLKGLTYGSPEYKAATDELGVALDHHYALNSHHPQHYPNGVNGMSLLDILEMFADWHSAGKRHADGDFTKSLDINDRRFGLSIQLAEIFRNTQRELGW